MELKIKSVQQLGQLSRAVRKSQGLDQTTAAIFSGSAKNFVSQFENGKSSVEIGRVFDLLENLGVELSVNVSVPIDPENKEKLLKSLDKLGFDV
ncbi:hypothetical protein A9Q81_08405 [Gammaproteobacteria bacterium 42_54_T18]|nr:hypothetical protein A9Q81_08405 [Gammaproteobacteria bacterium 42_54_T18]